MTIIKWTYVTTRKSLDDRFVDTPLLGGYVDEIHQLSINFSVSYSEDQLTRTRINWYDSSIASEVDRINNKWMDNLKAEKARRQSLGMIDSSFCEVLEK
jgi:hypothetical protein